MNIHCLGISHRTAPVEHREKLWFSAEEIRSTLPTLREKYFKEVVLLSTCNRTELYFVPLEQGTNGEPPWKLLARIKLGGQSVEEKHFYSLSHQEAAKHLFSVVSGIDSMVLGDVQILNQLKEAFTIAQESHSTGLILNRLFHCAFHVGKRARTETEIGEGAVSISYAAAELASKIFEDLSKRTALLIGAGETGKLTAKHLAGKNLGNLLLANRTRSRAEELVAQLGGRVVEYERVDLELTNADIVITAVESPTHIFSAAEMRQVMKLRSNKPLFVIDIGVPRNIDPAANTIDNVFLHDIDSLGQVIDHNLSRRRLEIPKIETIIEQEFHSFKLWLESLQVTPTIRQLRDYFEAIRQSEMEKHLHRFKPTERAELDLLTQRIINKILHTPMVNLRNGTTTHDESETQERISILRHLFGLDRSEG